MTNHRTPSRSASFLSLGLALALVGSACSEAGSESDAQGSASSASALTAANIIPRGETVTVKKVYDGDTIRLTDGRKVRFVGIDAPEEDPTRGPVQCFGVRAAEHLRGLLPKGTSVVLVADVESEDQYGRTLGYVYRVSDGMFVNAQMLREGYVQAYRVPPNVAHADEFHDLQAEARNARVGLWGKCKPGDLTRRPGGAQPPGR
ncbi:MAG: thermonuclease family protein [Acidimicrobiia bacterium]